MMSAGAAANSKLAVAIVGFITSSQPVIQTINNSIKLQNFELDFINTTHSIPETNAIKIGLKPKE